MEMNASSGWRKMLADYPWFNCEGCFPLPAYSEFMPGPFVGRKPLGELHHNLLSDDDPWGWYITESEEELELIPGMKHIGHQILGNIAKLGRGMTENFIHGHGGENLRNNPYWPDELASRAGFLPGEKYVTFLPLMLSRTKDDKGRISWTFFGSSILDPEVCFWKNFFRTPTEEIPVTDSISFFTGLLKDVYDVTCSDIKSLLHAGFRIFSLEKALPSFTGPLLINEDSPLGDIKYLLTFRPFASLPGKIKSSYLEGKLALLPFPGSLVFRGMPGYNKLREELPLAGQIPLLNLVARNRGIGGLKSPQTGWIHEPRPGMSHTINEELLRENYHRTHRFQRVHRYQDELNEISNKVRLLKVLFSTEPEFMGLYDKPMARNSHIWTSRFELLLNGPEAGKDEILNAEKTILDGGLFGYRFFYPPMRVGYHDIYLHRPLVSYIPSASGLPVIRTDLLRGYITGYHREDREMLDPVELWPRYLNREIYMSAIKYFGNGGDHFAHQTSMNIIALAESWAMQKQKPLEKTFSRSILCVSKQKTLEQWLDELPVHSGSQEPGLKMKESLLKLMDNEENTDEPLTFDYSATRKFELNWWNDIKFLAHGEFLNKDNADVSLDKATQSMLKKHKRDLEALGDYLLSRYRTLITDTGMEGRAECGEMPFKWDTDFDYPLFSGWKNNQKDETYERNIVMIIPGNNRSEAVVFGDHYDTAYMEDIYEKSRGGSGARISANGADDNFSATSTLLQAAPVFLKLAREGKLERDIWLVHLTGEEFPSDCMGARHVCRSAVEKTLFIRNDEGKAVDLSGTKISGAYIMDMIGHNRDNDQDIFQISPGDSASSLYLAKQAHIANELWNRNVPGWNKLPERQAAGRGRRVSTPEEIPDISRFLHMHGEVRTRFNPHSSLFNTDGQIFSDVGLPVVLFMENYDINRSGYHDTKDTLENIDLDYGAAFAAIAIETVARLACDKKPGF